MFIIIKIEYTYNRHILKEFIINIFFKKYIVYYNTYGRK